MINARDAGGDQSTLVLTILVNYEELSRGES